MEENRPAAESKSNVDSQYHGKLPLFFLAVGVAILLLAEIVAHWKAFGWVKKLIAVCLVANMFLQPPFRPGWPIFRRMQKTERDPDMLVFGGLTNLLLAVVLFT